MLHQGWSQKKKQQRKKEQSDDMNSEDSKVSVHKNKQVWVFHMVNTTTKKVRIGVSQGRCSSDLAVFCLSSLEQNTPNTIEFRTDEWGGSKKIKYDSIDGYNIVHRTVNHELGKVGPDLVHTNDIEMLNGRSRDFCLTSMNGTTTIYNITGMLNIWMTMVNTCENFTDLKKLGKRFLNFGKALRTVMESEYENGEIRILDESDLQKLPTNTEIQRKISIEGWTTSILKQLSTQSHGNIGYFKRGYEMAQTSHRTLVKQCFVTSEGEFRSQVKSMSTGRFSLVTICFIENSDNPNILFQIDNICGSCGNPECLKRPKSVTNKLHICKHMFAVLCQFVHGTSEILTTERLTFSEFCKEFGKKQDKSGRFEVNLKMMERTIHGTSENFFPRE